MTVKQLREELKARGLSTKGNKDELIARLNDEEEPRGRVRHVKSVVQHFFVRDDGENLVELASDTVTVSAKEWPGYSAKVLEQIDNLNENYE